MYATKRFELSYYRNEVMHIFVEEAALCCSLYACQKEKGNAIPEKPIKMEVLIEQVKFLSQLLKFEFIFSAGGAQANTEKTIQRLEVRPLFNFPCIKSISRRPISRFVCLLVVCRKKGS